MNNREKEKGRIFLEEDWEVKGLCFLGLFEGWFKFSSLRPDL